MQSFKEFFERKHICSTPGCRNRDTVRFAKSEGARSALFLCRDCIGGAFAAVLGVDVTGCRDIHDVASAVAFFVTDEQEKGGQNGE